MRGSCIQRGAMAVWEEIKKQMEDRVLIDRIRVNSTGCLGPCVSGPSIVVYPDGVWYQGVTPEDVTEIMDEHIMNGRPVQRLMLDPFNQTSDFLSKKIPLEPLDR